MLWERFFGCFNFFMEYKVRVLAEGEGRRRVVGGLRRGEKVRFSR